MGAAYLKLSVLSQIGQRKNSDFQNQCIYQTCIQYIFLSKLSEFLKGNSMEHMGSKITHDLTCLANRKGIFICLLNNNSLDDVAIVT